jgi:hypothetical protein
MTNERLPFSEEELERLERNPRAQYDLALIHWARQAEAGVPGIKPPTREEFGLPPVTPEPEVNGRRGADATLAVSGAELETCPSCGGSTFRVYRRDTASGRGRGIECVECGLWYSVRRHQWLLGCLGFDHEDGAIEW